MLHYSGCTPLDLLTIEEPRAVLWVRSSPGEGVCCHVTEKYFELLWDRLRGHTPEDAAVPQDPA